MTEAPSPHRSPVIATSADGTVRVTLHADGLIESVTLDPRVKRLPVDDLGKQITAALTAAQQKLLQQVNTRDREEAQQAEKRLSAELENINAEYRRQTAVFEATAIEILNRIDS